MWVKIKHGDDLKYFDILGGKHSYTSKSFIFWGKTVLLRNNLDLVGYF